MSKNLLAVALSVSVMVAVAGCAGKDTAKIEGTRIPVLGISKAIDVDATLAAEPLGLPEAVTVTEWPQTGGNAAHGGFHAARSDENLTSKWSVKVGAGTSREGRIVAQPVVSGGVAYVLDAAATVRAVEMGSGKILWQQRVAQAEEKIAPVEDVTEDKAEGFFKSALMKSAAAGEKLGKNVGKTVGDSVISVLGSGSDGQTLAGGLAFGNGRVFVVTGSERLVALDATSGAKVWQTRLPAPGRSPPNFADGTVFLVTIDNHSVAVDAADGSVKWRAENTAENVGLVGGASPAVAGNAVVSAYSNGDLAVHRADTGREVWSDNLSTLRGQSGGLGLADLRADPVIAGGNVFGISVAGRMMVFDLRSGARVWQKQIGGQTMPLVIGNHVFMVSDRQELLALNAEDGRVRWVVQLPRFGKEDSQKDPIFWTAPVLSGGSLILGGSNGQLLVVSPQDGSAVQTIKTRAAISVMPVAVADGVLILNDDARLVFYQ